MSKVNTESVSVPMEITLKNDIEFVASLEERTVPAQIRYIMKNFVKGFIQDLQEEDDWDESEVDDGSDGPCDDSDCSYCYPDRTGDIDADDDGSSDLNPAI